MDQYTNLSLLPLQSWVLMTLSTQQIPHLWLYPFFPAHTQIPLLFPSHNYSAVRWISVPLSSFPFVAPFFGTGVTSDFLYSHLEFSFRLLIGNRTKSKLQLLWVRRGERCKATLLLSSECLPNMAPLIKQLKPASSQSLWRRTRLTSASF